MITLKNLFLYLSSLLAFILSTFTTAYSKEKSDLFRVQLQLEQLINESFQNSIFNNISTHEQSSYIRDVAYDLRSGKNTVLSSIEALSTDFLYHRGQRSQSNEEMLIEVLNDESFGDGGFNFGYSNHFKHAHYLFVSQLAKHQNNELLEHEDANYFAVVVPDSDLLYLIISSFALYYFANSNFFNKLKSIHSNKILSYLQKAISQFSFISLLILLCICLFSLLSSFIQRYRWLINLTLIGNMFMHSNCISNKFDMPFLIRRFIKTSKNIFIAINIIAHHFCKPVALNNFGISRFDAVIFSIKKSINIQFSKVKIKRGIL
ncbi:MULTISPECIES: hypothetical protein [Cysteiniphilum]|nr:MULTISPECIES: hypothetical protein [Cysteiniphilum]